MKKLVVLIISMITFPSMAQKIDFNSNFWSFSITKEGKLLKMSELEEAVNSNKEALALIQKARTNKTFADITSFIGGFGVGWSLGSAIGGKANWTPALIGSGFIVLSIPFSSGFTKNTKKGIELYNSSLNNTAEVNENTSKLSLLANSNGIGLQFTF